MHIIEVTWRHRNDFRFIAYCRHCGERSEWPDGYADAMYQQCVFPARHCPDCGLNEAGEPEAPEPLDPDRLREDRDERRAAGEPGA